MKLNIKVYAISIKINLSRVIEKKIYKLELFHPVVKLPKEKWKKIDHRYDLLGRIHRNSYDSVFKLPIYIYLNIFSLFKTNFITTITASTSVLSK